MVTLRRHDNGRAPTPEPEPRHFHIQSSREYLPFVKIILMSPGALTREQDVREAYAAHAGELYGFAMRSLGDPGLAEEAVQETFLRAWRAGERFDPQIGSLRTWLFAILRNVVIDLGRARASRPGSPRAASSHRSSRSTRRSSPGRWRRRCGGSARTTARS